MRDAIAADIMEPHLPTGKRDIPVVSRAKDFSVDLLVIGRHNGAGITGRLRHNAYAILRASPCPIISV